jgi:hypothetical protein
MLIERGGKELATSDAGRAVFAIQLPPSFPEFLPPANLNKAAGLQLRIHFLTSVIPSHSYSAIMRYLIVMYLVEILQSLLLIYQYSQHS